MEKIIIFAYKNIDFKMKTKLLSLILFTALFTSCKDQKETTPEANKPAEPIFKVTVNAIVKKDDNFAFFYTEDGSTNFKIEPTWLDLKGSDAPQDIVWNLPADVYPTELRLDFGIKPDQEDVVLKSVTLEYNNKKKVFTGAEIGNVFRADESKCTFDPATGIIHGKMVDGKKIPSLYPNEKALGEELTKLQ